MRIARTFSCHAHARVDRGPSVTLAEKASDVRRTRTDAGSGFLCSKRVSEVFVAARTWRGVFRNETLPLGDETAATTKYALS